MAVPSQVLRNNELIIVSVYLKYYFRFRNAKKKYGENRFLDGMATQSSTFRIYRVRATSGSGQLKYSVKKLNQSFILLELLIRK